MEDIKKYCRICLISECNEISCSSVFDKDNDDIKIAKKIYDISGVFIEKTDFLPERICKKCYKILNLSYIFRLTCQETDFKLKESKFTSDIVEFNQIKIESIDNLLEAVEEENFIENKEESVEEDDIKSLLDCPDFITYTNDESCDEDDKTELNCSTIEKLEEIENDELKPGDVPIQKFSKKKRRAKDGSPKESNRRLCKFNKAWLEEFQWIREGENNHYATCNICRCQFSISHSGRSDIIRHINTEKHKQNTNPAIVKQKVFRGNGIKVPQSVNEITVIICEVCGNKYPSKTHLRRHMKYHSDVLEYECEICKKQFRLSMQLRKHMRVHTGERPYECRFCGKRFTDFSSKLKHERSHTNERPYVCETCGKAFTSSGVAKKHRRTHTGEKPHHCQVCNKSFAEKNQLVTHYKSFLHQSRAAIAEKNQIKIENE